MTDADGVTVSNGYADNNAPYDVAAIPIGGKRFQKVIPCDASGTPTGGVTQDVNLTQVGGVATSLGQKIEAESIPVVIATEQDTAADTGGLPGNATKICTWDGFNEVWTAFPNENGTPVVAVARDNGGSLAMLLATNTTPGASDLGLVTRNIPSGEQDISYAAPTSTTANLTAIGTTATVSLGGLNNVVFSVRGTYTNVAFIFEGRLSSLDTWNTILANRLDSNTLETASGTISSIARAWEVSVNGLSDFQVRCTAYGSGTATIRINTSYSATEPTPAIGTHAVTLSSTTITSLVPGTAATSLGKAIDAVAGATDTGIANLAQRVDTPAALTPANGDYFLLRGNNLGQLWVAAVQSGTWSVNCMDGNGNKLGATASTPGLSDNGLVVKNIPAWPATGGLPVSVALNTATLTQILASNSSRKYLYIHNAHTDPIGIRLSSNTTNPTINSIRIAAGASWKSDLCEWTGAVHAIGYTTAGNVEVSEQT